MRSPSLASKTAVKTLLPASGFVLKFSAAAGKATARAVKRTARFMGTSPLDHRAELRRAFCPATRRVVTRPALRGAAGLRFPVAKARLQLVGHLRRGSLGRDAAERGDRHLHLAHVPPALATHPQVHHHAGPIR